MSFSDDLKRFEQKVEVRSRDVFVNVASHALESIVRGSPVTGAPPMPVDTGAARAGWTLTFPDQFTAEIGTNVEYASYIEQGINRWGPVTYRVGGPHGVALTIAGLPRIVEVETKKVVG